ncbi:MAG: guanylate kinase [Chthonomonadales bacterium]
MQANAPLISHLLPQHGRLFVLSGPSGSGKDAVLTALMKAADAPQGIERCVTATTRPPREGEVHGKDYWFLTREEFENGIAQGRFLEYALYNGAWYGTPRPWVEEHTAAGIDVLLKIEVQGARQVKQKWPDAILVFLAPPSWEELERRIRSRASDDDTAIRNRLAIARTELEAAVEYTYLIVNDVLAEAASALRAIILAERCRIAPAGGPQEAGRR